MSRKRTQEPPVVEPAGQVILDGTVLELSVVRTEEGDYVGFPFLAVKEVRPGARVKVIVYEPVQEDS